MSNVRPALSNGSNAVTEMINPQTGEVTRMMPADTYGQAMGGGRSALAVGATSALMMAAEKQAIVKAQYEMARSFPRDWNIVRQRLLVDCKRPEFAVDAIYSKPVGGKPIEGLSIRFAETAARTAGNIKVTRRQVDEDRYWVRFLITVEDLESQTISEEELTIAKTVERKTPGDRTVVMERTNSKGEKVFVCIATEDELATKVKAQSQKVKRQLLLELLPADIKSDAKRAIYAARAQGATEPDAKKKLMDAFFGVGVRVQDLAEYLGHTVDTVQPAELVELRDIYNAIRDGETTWQEVMEAKPERGAGSAPIINPATATVDPAPSPAPAQTTTEGDPIDALFIDVAAASDLKALDKLMPRITKVPASHPRRGELGGALEARRKWLVGQKKD